jgi:phage baseplate assembly protein V
MYLRIGTVHAVDPATHRIRVLFDDQDADYISDWLPFFAWAGSYKLPEKGRQVWCILREEGEEDGLALCETWNDEDTPPESGAGMFYFRAPDGSKLKYHNGVMTIQAASIVLDGAVTVTGNLTAAHLKSNTIVEDAAGNVRI